MGLFDRIFSRSGAKGVALRNAARDRAALEEKSPNYTPPVLNPWLTSTPVYPLGDYFIYSTEGYARNELVYAGMRAIADAVAAAPLCIYGPDGSLIQNHPARQLLKRPNPFMGEDLLWEITILYLYLAGSMFWEKVRSRSGQVVELWPLRPDRVRILPDNAKYIAGYIYEIGGRQYPVDAADIIQFKFQHPIYEYWGMSPLQAALRRIAIDNDAADFVKVMFQNLAIPGIAIETQNAIDQATADRLGTKWMQKFGGRNRGKPLFMQSGMKVTRLSLTMQELSFPELDSANQTRILMALGVPPILVGATAGLDAATYSNFAQARASFYETTIEPLQKRLDDRINHDLIEADFGGGEGQIEARFDTSEVSALRTVRQERHESALNSFKAGAITRNQFLSAVGRPAEEGGDVYLIPINVQSVPMGEPTPRPPKPAKDPGPTPPAPPTGKSLAALVKGRDPAALETVKKVVLGRNDLAERYYSRLKTWAVAEFKRQARGVLRIFEIQAKAITHDQVAAILAEMVALELEWKREAAASVAPVIAGIMDSAGEATAAEVGISFDLSNQGLIDFIRQYSFKFAQGISDTSARDVKDVLLGGLKDGLSHNEVRAKLMEKFADWDSSRAEMVARTETIRAANAAAVAAYKQNGITLIVWVADPDACEYCAPLDGTTVGIDEGFFKLGDSYHPEGGQRAMSITYEDVGYPPLHPHCRCAIRAEIE